MELGLPIDSYLEKYRYKYLALYHALRDAIINGMLPEGTRLPATRELARQYGMSRGSAAQSYDMLLAEGYVNAMTGSGTYVARGASLSNKEIEPINSGPMLSTWGQRVLDMMSSPSGQTEGNAEELLAFTGERVASENFPYTEWKSFLGHAANEAKEGISRESFSAGHMELRRAIAGHLRFTRGIQADADHIVIFSGSMQGIVLLSQLLINSGDPVVLENPGYHGIKNAVQSSGGIIVPAEVDRSGLIPEDWNARLLFVTPSRQYPTGAVLSLERRRELLEWAGLHQAIIIEDDYDSEFRWGGRPMEPLKALDDGGHVIFIGSFSKTMFLGLRLGYAVLPKALVKPVIAAKALYEPVSSSLLEQRALSLFISRGAYSRHLRRMTRLYGGRHRFFCSQMEEKATHLFQLEPGDAGLHVYAKWLHDDETYELFKKAARKRGVEFRDAAVYRLSPGSSAACFGFSHLNEEQIARGVSRMALAWEDMQK
ncbi:MAG: PLP-dependent aminotransferase family protein [Bacillota bacterium]